MGTYSMKGLSAWGKDLELQKGKQKKKKKEKEGKGKDKHLITFTILPKAMFFTKSHPNFCDK